MANQNLPADGVISSDTTPKTFNFKVPNVPPAKRFNGPSFKLFNTPFKTAVTIQVSTTMTKTINAKAAIFCLGIVVS